jgi:glycosyltransferase involved in cell wall biosynthesis
VSATGSILVGSRAGAEALSVTLVQTTLPAYRRPFLETLEERLGGRLRVLAGNDYFEPTIRLDAGLPKTTVVRNRFLLGRRLLWQRHTVALARRADVVVLELNPRILSTWLLLLERRVLRKPTVLWGHAWPRGGVRTRSDAIRHLMRRLANAILVYSETEARDLRRLMPHTIVEAAPNALYPLAARLDAPSLGGQRATDIVFVGRLVEAKKPRLLLDAFLLARDDLPPDTRLVFVGDGPLRDELEAHASRAGARVLFMGTRTGLAQLQSVYAGALASVSPGTAGLSLIQSFWFGVPSVVAKDEAHGPEIEAVVDGVNGAFFAANSTTSLRDTLIAVARNRDVWWRCRGEIARECASRYSVDAMADAFLRIVTRVAQ